METSADRPTAIRVSCDADADADADGCDEPRGLERDAQTNVSRRSSFVFLLFLVTAAAKVPFADGRRGSPQKKNKQTNKTNKKGSPVTNAESVLQPVASHVTSPSTTRSGRARFPRRTHVFPTIRDRLDRLFFCFCF